MQGKPCEGPPTSVLRDDSPYIARSPWQIAAAVPFVRSNLRQDIGTLPTQASVHVPRRLGQAIRPVAPTRLTRRSGSASGSELTAAYRTADAGRDQIGGYGS